LLLEKLNRENALRLTGANKVEWPTLVLILACYGVWADGTTHATELALPLGIVVTGLSVALFSSLQHEVLHGHPFARRWLNEALVFPGITLFIPYQRFRDTHLAHHTDETLTDPFDDPEANYLDGAVWDRLPWPLKSILRFNNTLSGRLTVGSAVSQVVFMRSDWRAARAGDWQVIRAWALHVIGVAMVLAWLRWVGSMPVWAYVLAAYIGLSLIKIRTFLEHRAHEEAAGRTVIIEDRGPLAFLFLNNNFHSVHHMHPGVPWYRLPQVYFQDRARYLSRNGGYVYRSYGEIFARYFFRAKDPVVHPLWRRR